MQVNAQAATIAGALFPQRGIVRHVLLVAGGSAFVALSAQVRIHLPFTPVPITGQTFAVLLLGALLGSRLAGASLLTYFTEGVAGLPVFQGGNSGWAYIAGPTGGYIIGFIFAAYAVGWLAERGWDRWPWTTALAMLMGNVIIYLFGLPWLAHFVPDDKVFAFGLLPFIPGDTIKLLLAASLVPSGWMALQALSPQGLRALNGGGWQPPLALVTTFRVPWAGVYAAAGAAVVAGSLLPWGTDVRTGEVVNGIAAGEGVITLLMGVAMVAGAIAVRLAPQAKAAPVSQLWQFAASSVAAFIAYYEILYAAAVDDFWLRDVGWGLALLAAAAIVALLAALAESAPSGKQS
ncbi:MAG: biotin transporter BioY [Dehalococcoidia bacterium]